MDYILALVQGIAQGLTEFLPVSSSGHLNILQHFFGITEGNLFFNVMLHLGTLVSVIFFYRKLVAKLIKAFFSLVKDVFTGKFSFKNMDEDRNLVVMLIIGLVPLFLLFVPIGNDMKLKDLADIMSSGTEYFFVTGICLLVTSILLLTGIILNNRSKRMVAEGKATPKERYNVIDALVVGVTQAVAAIFPGISRSGSTLAAGQSRGIDKQKALDYTFVLGMPAIIAAAVLEGAELLSTEGAFNVDFGPVIVGMIVAAVVGYFSIALFKWLLKTDKTYVFVIYTALAGLAVLIVSIYEKTSGNIVTFV
ncbi:MAG: undecaprenyl-diphosphate phosphatase [Ruminococcaceae bacterium]|nr:undecaprenyl-diphosphate phosphatase [Oscillospiraceae bacterium]